MEILTWEGFGQAVVELGGRIRDDGYEPDVILGIARGGLPLAASLGYSLAVKNLSVLNVEYYTGVNERLDFPVLLPSPFDRVDLTGARLLIVDDVADTGVTLQLVHETVSDTVSDLRTAVLYEKPRSVVHCDYIWREVDQWIDFPWSSASQILAPPSAAQHSGH